MKLPPCVFTIAGSDSGAGAGVQADARTIQALGGYALTAITAVTAQNLRGVVAWRAVPAALITAQINAVLKDFPVAAIKTGLLPGEAAVRAVAKALARYPKIPLVIDPLIASTSGARFLDAAGVRALKRDLLPRATLITPNWPEAEALTDRRVRNFAEAEEAAKSIAENYGCAVLVKGGHAPGKVCRDCLVTKDGRTRWFESRRIKTRNTHGTGCVLSAAITMHLAQGETIETA
ncbi:MAG: bifunctional hydroxymethylpyrimidine kinase/phosphomethylpyrimidine kinase, partial [Verrucomicrobiota bacterium]|nr:bifunctional hydroxymethylpyrimidine kinase/phosphomethylpyrimidine kinase [Verrucomicrobiota bacterium]